MASPARHWTRAILPRNFVRQPSREPRASVHILCRISAEYMHVICQPGPSASVTYRSPIYLSTRSCLLCPLLAGLPLSLALLCDTQNDPSSSSSNTRCAGCSRQQQLASQQARWRPDWPRVSPPTASLLAQLHRQSQSLQWSRVHLILLQNSALDQATPSFPVLASGPHLSLSLSFF